MRMCTNCGKVCPNSSFSKGGVCVVCRETHGVRRIKLYEDGERIHYEWIPRSEKELFEAWRPGMYSFRDFIKEEKL